MNQTLFLMLGYPGAGKTTAAKLIRKLTGAEHLWADYERRALFGKPTYSHNENLRLYQMMNKETDQLLSVGKSVIFDTNFNYYKDREHLCSIAQKYKANTLLVWIKTPQHVSRQRAVIDAHKHHTRVLGHMSDEHFGRIIKGFEPPRSNETYIELDGTKISEDYVRAKLRAVSINF